MFLNAKRLNWAKPHELFSIKINKIQYVYCVCLCVSVYVLYAIHLDNEMNSMNYRKKKFKNKFESVICQTIVNWNKKWWKIERKKYLNYIEWALNWTNKHKKEKRKHNFKFFVFISKYISVFAHLFSFFFSMNIQFSLICKNIFQFFVFCEMFIVSCIANGNRNKSQQKKK